jgi:cytochrome c oxidase subunit 2
VRLLITSRDVIHSVFIPAWVKMDIAEDLVHRDHSRSLPDLCTEYRAQPAGTRVRSCDAPETFDEWIKDQQRGLVARQDVLADEEQVNLRGDLAEMGKRVAVDQGCLRCHSVNDAVYGTEQHIGPTWVDLYQRPTKLDDGTEIIADEAYLTESMMDPNAKIVAGYTAVMPSYQGKMSGPETAAVLEYIKRLRSDRVRQASVKGPLYEPVR